MAQKGKKKRSMQPVTRPGSGIYTIVAGFVVVVIIKIFLSFRFNSPFIIIDELIYDDLAKRLLEGHLYSTMGGYPPGYSALLSIPYLLSNDRAVTYHLMLVIGALVSTSIIFPAYYLLKGRVDEKVAIVSSLAMALLPAGVYYSFTLMSENLFIPLFLFSVLAVVKAIETKKGLWQVLMGISATGLYLTRSIGLVMIGGMVAAVLLEAYWHRNESGIIAAFRAWRLYFFTLTLSFIAWIGFSTFAADISLTGIFATGILTLAAGVVMIAVDRVMGSNILRSLKNFNLSVIAIGICLVLGLAATTSFFVFGDAQNGGFFVAGNAYNAPSVLGETFDYISNLSGLWTFLQLLLNHLAYLIIATFFVLPLLAATYFVGREKAVNKPKSDRNPDELRTADAYVFLSLAASLVISVIFTIFFVVIVGQTHVALGRYLEPFVPAILIFAVLRVDKLGKSMLVTRLPVLIAGYIVAFLIFVFTAWQEIGFQYIFSDMVNNAAVFWLLTWNDSGAMWLPVALLMLVSLAVAYVTMKSGRATVVLPAFIAACALVAAVPIYANGLSASSFQAGNDISGYLYHHTDKQTLVLVDSNMTDGQKLASNSIFIFWNSGKTYYTDEAMDHAGRGTVYLISTNDMPYRLVAKDSPFKLFVKEDGSSTSL